MDHVRVFFLVLVSGFSYILKSVSFKRKENLCPPQGAFCCCGFSPRIYTKSWHVRFCNFAVFVLAQGFSWKVATKGVLEDHGSETFFAFSHRDSLQKLRWQGSSTIIVQIHVLRSRTRILYKSRDQSSRQSILYFHRCWQNSCYFLRNYTFVRRWVMLASRWLLWTSCTSHYFHRNYTHFRRWIMLASR